MNQNNISLETVIKGLECCEHLSGEYCRLCPYREDITADTPPCCTGALAHDALALLTTQEPRVMTPEEVLSNIGTSAWLETWNGAIYTGWVLVYDRQTNGFSAMIRLGITQPNGHVSWLKEIDYGRTWRLWTTEPTDEQMEETPWS